MMSHAKLFPEIILSPTTKNNLVTQPSVTNKDRGRIILGSTLIWTAIIIMRLIKK